MGYSCSVRASILYDRVLMLDAFDISSPNYKYFCEIGRENVDGSITGIVYELVGEPSPLAGHPNVTTRSCKKKGGFKIDARGEIVRFPGVSKLVHGYLRKAALDEFDKLYPLPFAFIG